MIVNGVWKSTKMHLEGRRSIYQTKVHCNRRVPSLSQNLSFVGLLLSPTLDCSFRLGRKLLQLASSWVGTQDLRCSRPGTHLWSKHHSKQGSRYKIAINRSSFSPKRSVKPILKSSALFYLSRACYQCYFLTQRLSSHGTHGFTGFVPDFRLIS